MKGTANAFIYNQDIIMDESYKSPGLFLYAYTVVEVAALVLQDIFKHVKYLMH